MQAPAMGLASCAVLVVLVVSWSTARPLTQAGTAQGGAGTRGPMWLGFAMPPLGLSLLLLLCLVLLLVL